MNATQNDMETLDMYMYVCDVDAKEQCVEEKEEWYKRGSLHNDGTRPVVCLGAGEDWYKRGSLYKTPRLPVMYRLTLQYRCAQYWLQGLLLRAMLPQHAFRQVGSMHGI